LPDIGDAKIITSVDVTIFRPPQETADRRFLANVFSTPLWFKMVSERSGGTTRKRIARGALGKLFIRVPPIEEQTKIADVLSEMETEIVSLEEETIKVHAVKRGMMQELLTGRIRLV
jgi:type I restriction enzyme S subunit